MLTPCFEVRQDDTFIIIVMRVPFAKATEAEFHIDGSSFKFYCKPYFLRLCLPGELIEDGRERAEHDIDKGTITVYVPKCNPGQHFENLGMITSLLSKKSASSEKVPYKPLFEVISGTDDGLELEEEEEFDWQVDQQVPVDEMQELCLERNSSKYGFAEQYSAVFTKLQGELPALVDCPDPDHMSSRERRVARLAHEEASFSPDHYLADLMEGGERIECVCQFQPHWLQQAAVWEEQMRARDCEVNRKAQREPDQDIIPFTDAEKVQLKELPNKEYLRDKATERPLYLGLVDVIFAYAYDRRVTEGEHNVESAWTVCKLSSTLSWLEVFRGSVEEVVYCSVRRCLCYPLYRHWKLVQSVLQDTVQLFLLGRRKLLQCLLAIRTILNSSEPYYVMNNLYITDYCIWIQKASAKQIQRLAQELRQVEIRKSSMGWELEELEQAAHLVAARGSSDTESSSREEEASSSCTDDEGEREADDELGTGEASESSETPSSGGRSSVSESAVATERDISTLLGATEQSPKSHDRDCHTVSNEQTENSRPLTHGSGVKEPPPSEGIGASNLVSGRSTSRVTEATTTDSVEGLSKMLQDLLTLQPQNNQQTPGRTLIHELT